jgi:putative endonuclease
VRRFIAAFRPSDSGLAVTFLKSHGLLEYPARFDVVAITWPAGKRSPTIEHFQDAFEAVGKWELYS